MVLVEVFGIDPYSLRQVSKDLTPKLSEVCEVSKDEINFYGTEGLLVHDGVEQNTWNIVIKVVLLRRLQVIQKEISKLLVEYFKDIAIHVTVIYSYYLQEEKYVYKNEEYPLFLTEKNIVEEDDEFEDDDNIDDIYTGDAFKDFKDKVGK